MSKASINFSADGRNHFSVAVQDILSGLAEWRSWGLLSVNDLRQRYRRSSIGQFWITIAIAANILGIGLVFSVVFKQPVAAYMPFLGAGLIVWSLISTTVNELATAYTSSATYLQSYPGSRAVVVYRVVARNVIQFGHNLLIMPVLWLVFSVDVSWAALLLIPGVILCITNAVWIGLLIGPLSARFRDIPQLLQQAVSLIFFLTPIMYRPDQVREHVTMITDYNPVYYFVEILREPLLGRAPEARIYFVAIGVTLVGYVTALAFYGRFKRRINYWL
jgi:ABC-type polysaccharide/polyol phosphate export permease